MLQVCVVLENCKPVCGHKRSLSRQSRWQQSRLPQRALCALRCRRFNLKFVQGLRNSSPYTVYGQGMGSGKRSNILHGKHRKVCMNTQFGRVAVLALACMLLAFTALAAQTAYRGNAQSRIFHAASCRYFACKQCTFVFSSREEAIQAGFRPCKVCRP